MNRQLISNQPLKDDLEDLDQIDFFQTRERQVRFEDGEEQKQRPEPSSQTDNNDYGESRDRYEVEDSAHVSRKNTKRYHQLQVIDEDTEHFKAKLDNLLNNFRSETITEFMSIKRSLLQEQTDAIESETRKYSKLLENRTNELDKTKEVLARKLKEIERAEVIIHVLSDWAGTARNKKRNALLLSKCFNGFKNYKKQQEAKLKANKMADMIYEKKCSGKVFGAWRSSHYALLDEKKHKEFDATLNRELSDLAAKYNKEIDMLNARLSEALKSLDEAEKNKAEIQENLKKAFMRGVCALNFEAMSVLKSKGPGEEEPSEQVIMTKQIEKIGQDNPFFNSLALNPVDDNEYHTEEHERTKESQISSSPRKNIVFYQNPKLESKDMRWRDAPVVGMGQSSEKKAARDPILKPSSYIGKIENKENEKDDNQADRYQTSLAPMTHTHNDDEGRVIKVNHGKSFGVTPGSGTNGTSIAAGKQIKGQEKTVTVNSNKAAQLRTQLSKSKK